VLKRPIGVLDQSLAHNGPDMTAFYLRSLKADSAIGSAEVGEPNRAEDRMRRPLAGRDEVVRLGRSALATTLPLRRALACWSSRR
jgi:hypothetical protein